LRGNKYKAKRADGFPSKLEKAVYDMLVNKYGEDCVQRQSVVVLQDGDKKTKINWKIDFKVQTTEGHIYVEAKGVETGEFKLKLKLFRKLKPAPLEIWKGRYRNGTCIPFLKERIE